MPSEFCPDNTLSPNEHEWAHSRATGRRWCKACGESAPVITRVDNLRRLTEVAAMLGVKPDWHEPDEQDVTAHVFGQSFDNAGTWPFDPTRPADTAVGSLNSEGLEMYVELRKEGLPVAHINLATLFAMACGTLE